MDFKSLATVLVFNIITQALPIGTAIYLAIRWALGAKTITITPTARVINREKLEL